MPNDCNEAFLQALVGKLRLYHTLFGDAVIHCSGCDVLMDIFLGFDRGQDCSAEVQGVSRCSGELSWFTIQHASTAAAR